MEFKKIEPNCVMEVSKNMDDFTTTKTFSFYASKEPKAIIGLINTRFCATYDAPCKVKVKIIRDKEIMAKTFPYHDLSIEDIKSRIEKCLFSSQGIVDVKNTRYKITVFNTISSQLDRKKYVFNCEAGFDELFSIVKNHFCELEKKVVSEELIHDDYKKRRKSSHYVTLSMEGTFERSKKSSKTFKINLPSHSSQEILQLMGGDVNE
jgi:hypothetical protein